MFNLLQHDLADGVRCVEKTRLSRCFTLVYAYGLRIVKQERAARLGSGTPSSYCFRVIGKGNKERALPLTESMLEMLRNVWRTHRSERWLFPSQRIVTPLTYSSAHRS